MYNFLRASAICLSCALLMASASMVRAGLVVGGFDASRGGQAALLSGDLVDEIRASFLTNFPSASLVESPTLNPGFLATLDVLIATNVTGNPSFTTLSPAEQIALHDYVLGGGRVLMILDGFDDLSVPDYQNFPSSLGITIVQDAVTGPRVMTPDSADPSIFNGPYGDQMYGVIYGAGDIIGPATAIPVARESETGSLVMAAFDNDGLGPGSGRVIVLADANAFADSGVYPIGFGLHEKLFLNSIHYLTAPEPPTWGLGVLGGIGLFAARVLQRRRAT